MKKRRPDLRLPVLTAVLSLAVLPAAAQQTAPYDHPLFTGPAHATPEPSFDQQHLRLAVGFDFDSRRVLGDATLRLARVDSTLDSLVLQAADFAIDSVLTGPPGAALTPARWRIGAADSLIIALDSLHAGKAPFEVRIVYEATPHAGLYFIEDGPLRQIWTQGEMEDHHHWFPLIDRPGDKLTSELLVTVPAPWRVLSNGQRVDSTTHADGTITYHWRQAQPHAPYLVMLAAGDYAVFNDTVILEPAKHPVPLAYWVYPMHSADDIERTFGRTGQMMQFFTERFGYPYPWPQYAQVLVHHFQFGGMENTGATTLTDRTLVDERGALDYDPDGLIAHELAHQWFGDLVTTHTWSDTWLNEGFATYGSALFAEHEGGADALARTMQGLADDYFKEAEGYRRPLVWNRWTAPIQMFDAHSYRKGAWVLHMLRHRLGDDTFFAVLDRYLDAYAFQSVETSDLWHVIEAVSDQRFDAFFDQWAYHAGHPELEIDYEYRPDLAQLYVTVRQLQTGFMVPEIFDLDLEFDVHTLTERTRHTLPLRAREQLFELPVTAPPRFVAVDPGRVLLADVRLDQPAAAWVAQLRYAPSPTSRFDAARALKAFREDPALLVGLRSAWREEKDPAVRGAIIETLGVLPSAPPVERALLDALGDADAATRQAALKALGSFTGSDAVAQAAFEVAQNDASPAVQAEAVLTLARIGAPEALGVTRSALVTPSFRETIRQAAFEALALLDLPSDEALKIGLDYSRPEQPSEVRTAALAYLSRFAAERPPALIRLTDALSDPDYRVRQAAIKALGGLDDARAQAALRSRLTDESDARLRLAIEEALAEEAATISNQ